MTLSMSQSVSLNPISTSNTSSGVSNNNSDLDFSTIMNILLESSLNNFSSDSTSSSSMQTMLLSLLPYLANLNSSNSVASAPSGAPVNGILTQDYSSVHQGLDFGVDVGTDVKSTISGEVTYAGWNDEGYGNLVIVDNGTYQTYYGHLDSVNVSVGENVSSGEVVGLSGNTGNSTGPHLHYEVRVNGNAVNPTTYTYGKISQYFV
jgi:murein DD-endopeptidase MepM/ murein hydrolase activator NlpD